MGYKRVVKGLLISLSLVAIIGNCNNVQAYNFNDEHKVNTNEHLEENQKTIWNYFRANGFSEQATAGIMGNIQQECGYDNTRVQGNKPFGPEFANGHWRGIGIAQWTNGRQLNLIKLADQKGVQWMDLNTQLEFLLGEMSNSQKNWIKWATIPKEKRFSSLDEYKECKDIERTAYVFYKGFERAGDTDFQKRLNYANQSYSKFTGTPISDIDTGNSGSTSGGNSSLITIIAEKDLVGMPKYEGIASDIVARPLPDGDSLSTSEKVSVSEIRNSIIERHKWSAWDTARVGVVFIGLVLLVFGVLLGVSYLFDKVNTIVEISLVSVVSLGTLRFTHEEGVLGQGYVNKDNILKIEFIIFCVGFFLISGALFNWLIDIIYFINNAIGL